MPALRQVLSSVFALLAFASAAVGQDGTQKWAFSTLSTSNPGNILSSPTVGPDGTVYIGVEVGTSTSVTSSGRLFAIRPDGSEKWSYTVPDWVDAAPAVGGDGTVYFGSWDGTVYALKPDGSLLWSYKTGSFISSSPSIATDGTVYVGAGDGNLYALTDSGALKWIFPTEDWIESSPAIGPDGTVYVASWDKKLYAVTPDGTEKWRYVTSGEFVSSPAIAANGTVYIGCRDNQLHALYPSGALKWVFGAGDVIDASPVIGPDGAVFFGTLGGRFFALNPDGTERWQYPRVTQPAIKSIYSSAAVRADGSVLFGSSDAAVFALNSAGVLVWKTSLGDWVDSSPVVAPDGAIYVGCTDKKLYALNGSVPSVVSDWSQFRRDTLRNGQQVIGRIRGTGGRLINLSTRAVAGTGADTLITGFVMAGDGQRSLLVRGLGPALIGLGVTGVLTNPQLSAYSGSNVIATNDDWGKSANAAELTTTFGRVGAFPLGSASTDAVLLQTLNPSPYTVQVTGAGGGTGVALMEVYDAGGTGTSRLINLSARSAVGTGGNILIAGLVIAQNTRTVLVRGLGPALTGLGVPGVLADPQLKIFRGSQLIAENNDWGSTSDLAELEAAVADAGAWMPATGSKDAMLVLTLPPGPYTAQISGINQTTGVALVEVYEVP